MDVYRISFIFVQCSVRGGRAFAITTDGQANTFSKPATAKRTLVVILTNYIQEDEK